VVGEGKTSQPSLTSHFNPARLSLKPGKELGLLARPKSLEDAGSANCPSPYLVRRDMPETWGAPDFASFRCELQDCARSARVDFGVRRNSARDVPAQFLGLLAAEL
jgi:hypothetical protein